MAYNTIDCDVHPAISGLQDLLPYYDDYWRDFVSMRELNGMDLGIYRPSLPLSARPDWLGTEPRAGASLDVLQGQLLDPFKVDIAICTVLNGASSFFNPYFAAATCKASNDWLIENWLAKDARLRGSIMVSIQDPDLAAEEIERLAGDRRFVQVVMPVAGDMPFGRRYYWPIYRAAAKHGLPIAIHPGGGGRYQQSYIGNHSLYLEDYALQASTMAHQMLSLIYEGVFSEFPDLKVVMLESGVTWVPSYLTDAENKWMALRREVPWVDKSPWDYARKHFRFTTQPFDAPNNGEIVNRVIDMLGSEDMLLFSTDYPHFQFNGDNALPTGLSDERIARLKSINPLATYSRLSEAV
ncbi:MULTISPECIES: amidohydrolase family protein [unclassified Devosia]|uniref:amidohydrolase family protein n=1 Tax=unclassified Devosia TaxID=196773 RepID=UPI00145D8005|nr:MULTISPECIES: amidohydrolase family protein [unclassified Devosia]MBJ6988039.1 amidohydrolase [Devosia sp. MC521]QMW62110.1 amidohydrolase [Devosia sp. MC521]